MQRTLRTGADSHRERARSGVACEIIRGAIHSRRSACIETRAAGRIATDGNSRWHHDRVGKADHEAVAIHSRAGHLDILRAGNANTRGGPTSVDTRTNLEVVALTLIRGSKVAIPVLFHRANLDHVLTAGVERVAEPSACKEVEARKVPGCVRGYLAFHRV